MKELARTISEIRIESFSIDSYKGNPGNGRGYGSVYHLPPTTDARQHGEELEANAAAIKKALNGALCVA